jgi:hypothetical protein
MNPNHYPNNKDCLGFYKNPPVHVFVFYVQPSLEHPEPLDEEIPDVPAAAEPEQIREYALQA